MFTTNLAREILTQFRQCCRPKILKSDDPSPMKTQNEEYLLEALVESSEIINGVIDHLIKVEKDPEYSCLVYREVFRGLHSLKGAISLVGLSYEAERVHICESVFKKCSDDLVFYPAVIHTMIDFLGKLTECFAGSTKARDQLVDFDLIFQSLLVDPSAAARGKESLEIDIKKVTEENCGLAVVEKKRALAEVIILGKSERLESELRSQSINFDSFDCHEKLYLLGRNLSKAKILFLVISSCQVNPLLVVRILNSLVPSLKIVLIADAIKFSFAEVPESNMYDFSLIGTSAKNFNQKIQVELKLGA